MMIESAADLHLFCFMLKKSSDWGVVTPPNDAGFRRARTEATWGRSGVGFVTVVGLPLSPPLCKQRLAQHTTCSAPKNPAA